MRCWPGWHRYRSLFVSNDRRPNDHVTACARCGREPRLMRCWLGWHRYRWLFVGNDWQPNDYVKACTRCGREPM